MKILNYSQKFPENDANFNIIIFYGHKEIMNIPYISG